MAQSKTAKKRKKAGQISTGCYALSYDAQKGAVYSDKVEKAAKRDRKSTKQSLKKGDW